MLDIKYVRANFEQVKKMLETRNEDLGNLDDFEALDVKRRELIAKGEVLKAERNKASEQISIMKRNKENADEKTFEIIDEVENYIKEYLSDPSRIGMIVHILKKDKSVISEIQIKELTDG